MNERFLIILLLCELRMRCFLVNDEWNIYIDAAWLQIMHGIFILTLLPCKCWMECFCWSCLVVQPPSTFPPDPLHVPARVGRLRQLLRVVWTPVPRLPAPQPLRPRPLRHCSHQTLKGSTPLKPEGTNFRFPLHSPKSLLQWQRHLLPYMYQLLKI